MGKDTFTITDNRTGKNYEIPVTDDTIRAMDLRQIKVHEDDFGTMSYDPAFKNTASTRTGVSNVTTNYDKIRDSDEISEKSF